METTENIEGVGGGNLEGRGLHAAHAYRVFFAQESLDFRPIEIDDPVPLGRQLLIAAGLSASEDYSLFAILETGDFEDVRLDETFDLRGRGVERFVAFLTDRDFKLTVNDAQITWGKSTITGVVLYELAKPRENEAVFLSVRGGADRQIHPDETVDLSQPGVEHFITALKQKPKIEIVVNGREVEVAESHVTFEQLVSIAYPGEPPTPDIKYSITYRGAASKPHSGELATGGSVEIKNGSIFNVGRTIQS
jgi:hypothetical protein